MGIDCVVDRVRVVQLMPPAISYGCPFVQTFVTRFYYCILWNFRRFVTYGCIMIFLIFTLLRFSRGTCFVMPYSRNTLQGV
jgi:hypothetical protein